MKASIYVKPAYPNPTTRFTAVRYSVPTKDSIKIWIENEEGHKSIIRDKNFKRIGIYEEQIDLLYDESGNKREPGIYRLYFDVITQEEIPLIKGDIKLTE